MLKLSNIPRLRLKKINVHNTCMKKFQFKVQIIIEIFCAQTHQLCTYNFILKNQFSMFIDRAMQVCVIGASPLLFLYSWLLPSLSKTWWPLKILIKNTIVKVLQSHDNVEYVRLTHGSHCSYSPQLLWGPWFK